MHRWDLRKLLELPSVYRWFQRVVSGGAAQRLVCEYLRPNRGDRVLDIGCGPGHLLEELGPVDYVGFDYNADYIRQAQARFGTRGRFMCLDVANAGPIEIGQFDLVIAIGVLHHLDDEAARNLLRLAKQSLKPNGRLVTLDGCFTPRQSAIARAILRNDRGRFVRTEPEYLRLVREYFPSVEVDIRRDFIRIPYTHIILTCRPQSVASEASQQAAA